MDSSFKRQAALYDPLHGRHQNSSTALNNLGSSLSRLASPAVGSSALGASSRLGAKEGIQEPLSAASEISNVSHQADPGWKSGALGSQDGHSINTAADPAFSSARNGYNSVSTGVYGNSQGLGYPGVMNYQYANLYGSDQSNSQNLGPYGSQYGVQYGSQYTGYSIYPSQYGFNQYGAQYANPYEQYGTYNGSYAGNQEHTNTRGTSVAVSSVSGDAGINSDSVTTASPTVSSSAIGAGAGAGANKSPLSSSSTTQMNGIVLPASIFWCYIDLSSQEQGPFSGDQMNAWIDYMMDVTMLRRSTDSFYVSFAVLKSVLGSETPFTVLLTQEAWDTKMKKAGDVTAAQVQQVQDDSSDPIKYQTMQQATSALGRDGKINAYSGQKSFDNITASVENLQVDASKSANQPSSKAALSQLGVRDPDSNIRAEPAETPSVDPWKKPVRSTQVKISDIKKQVLGSQQSKKKSADNAGGAGGAQKTSQGRWLTLDELQNTNLSNTTDAGATPTSANGGSSVADAGASPTWTKKSVVPARSLADIQKEQAQAQKSKNSHFGGTIPKVSSPLKSIDAHKGGKHPAQNQTSTRGSSYQSSAPNVKGRNSRSAQPMSFVTASANSASPANELVHWVRVSLKDLVHGVDCMELLEVFLTLGNNNSAKEFISESIFEYSRTLDGRKFASDFLSRKKIAEDAMQPGETWKDILNHFNPNQEQDPTFKVVSKKRIQKIARPGDSIN